MGFLTVFSFLPIMAYSIRNCLYSWLEMTVVSDSKYFFSSRADSSWVFLARYWAFQYSLPKPTGFLLVTPDTEWPIKANKAAAMISACN